MPRWFDVLVESPASVEQVHAAFGDEDYWRHRFAGSLDSLIADGTVTVGATPHLGHHLLPGLVAKLIRDDLKALFRKAWRPVGDRRVHGQVNVSAPGTCSPSINCYSGGCSGRVAASS